ncbi:hypothetical protein RX330_20450 [Bradyrhizobium sp. NDS-1]|uniref:hypothetical protein n=1 Tax=Bradyrhizobium sp. NDS-1 TaxID=3080014 RepID=UPI00293EB613|nr:hypothetical protein [Bradyrhizobium sp. NDS-1]WOH70670.1 hypothetical protein RX330_20450 [Bradyrhizobium sp. NDS-1]
MAKKNEILLSIALEGDQEIKGKLAAVGEAGKKSLADIEKQVGAAGSRLEKLAKPLEGVRGGLAPLLEQAGLARLSGLFGGSGGLLSGLSGAAGPAALGTVLSGIALHLAKVREESEKTEARLKSLGGGSKAVAALNESAKKLGTSPSQLQEGFENFLGANRKQRAEEDVQAGLIHPPGYVPPENEKPHPRVFQGGKQVFGPAATVEEFAAAQRALLAGTRLDKTKPEDAKRAVDQLLGSIFQPHDVGQGQAAPGLTADAVRAFDRTSPSAANRLARALGGTVGRGFGNAEELALFLDRKDKLGRTEPIPPNKFFDAVAKDEPQALKDAQAARGVSDALDGLKSSAERLDKSFGDTAGKQINQSLTEQIDQFSGGISKATDLINRNGASIEKGSEIGRAIGDKTPIPFAGAIGSTLGSITGGTIGIGGDLIRQGLGSTVGGFLGKALTDPGALQEKARPTEGPSALAPPSSFLDSVSPKALLGPADDSAALFERRQQELKSFQDRGLSPEREGGGFLIAPERPSPVFTPEQTQPTQPPQQFGAVDSAQQLASLGTALQDALRGLVQGITDKAGSLGPQQDNRIQGPVDGIGIRGEGSGTIGSDVADASGALKQFASALLDSISSIKAASAAAPQTVQAAAGGGLIRHLDGGGHLSGPGTSTSDSIPAMLSDGEYVIKASSARKIGRSRLDWLNAGNYAGGGFISRMVSRVRGFASGGQVDGFDLVAAMRRVRAEEEEERERKRKAEQLRKDQDWVYRLFNPQGPEIATGGLITSAGVVRPAHFARGGAVGNLSAFAGMTASFPHFAEGGMLDVPSLSGPAPQLDNIAPAAGGAAGHYDVDLRTNHGDFRMMTTEDVARKMSAAARDAANASAGAAPSWEYGR